jgi:hypothetical protein
MYVEKKSQGGSFYNIKLLSQNIWKKNIDLSSVKYGRSFLELKWFSYEIYININSNASPSKTFEIFLKERNKESLKKNLDKNDDFVYSIPWICCRFFFWIRRLKSSMLLGNKSILTRGAIPGKKCSTSEKNQ